MTGSGPTNHLKIWTKMAKMCKKKYKCEEEKIHRRKNYLPRIVWHSCYAKKIFWKF
jgi:hypothetical protein